MRPIEVGCAIILDHKSKDENRGKILIAQRKPGGHLSGYWEFPGGKRREGESMQDCLVREVHEELGVRIRPLRLLAIKQHVYPSRMVLLYFIFCEWLSGRPVKHDCHDFRWVDPAELFRFRFPPADHDILRRLTSQRFF